MTNTPVAWLFLIVATVLGEGLAILLGQGQNIILGVVITLIAYLILWIAKIRIFDQV